MSMNLADIYGAMSSTVATLQPTSVGGPNQGAVATSAEKPPMASPGSSGNAAAFSWLGLILLLLIWRILIQMGGKI